MTARRALQLMFAVLIAAAAVWIVRHTYWDFIAVDDPPKGEAARNRYYTFEHLAQRLAIQTRPLTTLRVLPPVDHVLIVDDLSGAMVSYQSAALESWVVNGGRLLLSRGALLSNRELQTWTGVGFAHGVPAEDGAIIGSPNGSAPDAECSRYAERVAGRLTGRSYLACLGALRVAFSSTRTPAWSLSNGYGFQMLRLMIGNGSVSIIDCDCLMGNKSLLRADHARIVFDSLAIRSGDHIDTLKPAVAESLLALLWRHAAAAITLGLAAIGLAIWRNLPRLGPITAAAPPLRRSLAEQIRARARFAWRTRRLASLYRAEHEALTQLACRRLAFYERMSPAERVGALAAHTGLDWYALSNAMNVSVDGGAESQRAAITLLEIARRQLETLSFQTEGARA